MASSVDVETARIIDPRIDPDSPPAYIIPVGPKQNQYYTINYSALSSSYVAFNNLTTLGADRAYLDTFELLITARIKFHGQNTAPVDPNFTKAEANNKVAPAPQSMDQTILPLPDEWTFESFPFSKCCDIIRTNVNGNAFFSYPMMYLRAKERYWDDNRINNSYGNICPCNKPYTGNESGFKTHKGPWSVNSEEMKYYPMRLGEGKYGYGFAACGANTSTNNDIVPCAFQRKYQTRANASAAWESNQTTVPADSEYKTEVLVQWREPVFCSPFSSRYDQTWGKPLYNITSLDLSFNLQGLKNMIRHNATTIIDYDISLENVQLLFQVLTLPQGLTRPSKTTFPCRKFSAHLTDYATQGADPLSIKSESSATSDSITEIPPNTQKITLNSGQYTLNEVPSAIWIFAAPNKACLQDARTDGFYDYYYDNGVTYVDSPEIPTDCHLGGSGWPAPETARGNVAKLKAEHGLLNTLLNSRTCNFPALPMRHISISMANTTQLLNTAKPEDLYRIAKQNGCQDSYTSFTRCYYPNKGCGSKYVSNDLHPLGMGSYLRLVPGVDLILPETDLIPGANANNMVFQVESAEFLVPDSYPWNYRHFALWIIFEFVGVSTITPGQGVIVMNPLGDGRSVANAQIIPSSAVESIPTNEATVNSASGFGWWDKVKSWFGKAHKWVKDNNVISTAANIAKQAAPVLSAVPGVGTAVSAAMPYVDKVGEFAAAHGYGTRGVKRSRGGAIPGAGVIGGAVMGMGDFV